MQAPKNGFFYVLDRHRQADLGQDVRLDVTWAKGIDKKTGRPILDPEAADYWTKGAAKLVFPGPQGAHNWQPMASTRRPGWCIFRSTPPPSTTTR